MRKWHVHDLLWIILLRCPQSYSKLFLLCINTWVTTSCRAIDGVESRLEIHTQWTLWHILDHWNLCFRFLLISVTNFSCNWFLTSKNGWILKVNHFHRAVYARTSEISRHSLWVTLESNELNILWTADGFSINLLCHVSQDAVWRNILIVLSLRHNLLALLQSSVHLLLIVSTSSLLEYFLNKVFFFFLFALLFIISFFCEITSGFALLY